MLAVISSSYCHESDLNADDGQYHNNCHIWKLFMNHKHVQAAANSVARVPQPDDSSFDALIAELSA
jgi:hypothetical protein